MAEIDQEFVEFVVKALVGNPDKVEIKRSIDEKGVLLELTVDQEDLGRVIGKRGNTAQSIRTLLRALGTKNDARYNLKIVDPEGGERPPRRERDDRYERPAQAAAIAPVATDDDSSNDDSGVSDDNSNLTVSDDSAGASQWAHLSSSSDDSSSDEPAVEEEKTEEGDDKSSVVEKTREELADLEGLDI